MQSGYFLPLHTTMLALCSRVIVLVSSAYQAVSKAYKFLYKIASTPVLSTISGSKVTMLTLLPSHVHVSVFDFFLVYMTCS